MKIVNTQVCRHFKIVIIGSCPPTNSGRATVNIKIFISLGGSVTITFINVCVDKKAARDAGNFCCTHSHQLLKFVH